MSYNQSLAHSAYDSADSIATPPDSDFEDGQLRMMLASPLYTKVSGKPDAERVQMRESLMKSSSRDLDVSGKPYAVFSCHSESSQNTFAERDRGNESGNRFNSIFRFTDSANIGKSLLDGNKDHLLTQARSELMKQGHQVESLNKCINELQQQGYAQRLELEDAHHGFLESRREQSRLQEELSVKDKVLRETQIRNIHEMGEMKRAQEVRVEEFSVQKFRESHETIQKLT